jgi:hypothetical protein
MVVIQDQYQIARNGRDVIDQKGECGLDGNGLG